MAYWGFTFNSQHSNIDKGIRVKNVKRPILPKVKDRYIDIPGKDGSYLFSGDLEDALIEVTCYFSDASLADVRTRSRSLAVWLHTVTKSPLIFDDEAGVYYMAKIANQIDPSQIVGFAEFTLQFRCEPVAYEVVLHEDSLESQSGANALSVTNAGNYESTPIIEIAGRSLSVYAATFARNSSAYKQDGTLVNSGNVRYETGAYANIVTGGNFPSTTGWTPIYSSHSVSNNTLFNTADGTQAEVNEASGVIMQNVSGKKVYVRAKVKGNLSTTDLRLWLQGLSSYALLGNVSVTTNLSNYQTISGIITLSGGTAGESVRLLITHYYPDAATANGKVMEVQEVFAMDLTTNSLASKTAAECDALFPTWYDGSPFGQAIMIEEGTTNLVPLANRYFASWTADGGATVTLTQNQNVAEWGCADATRIQTSGGTSTLKYYLTVASPSANGQAYSTSMKVKNIGAVTVRVSDHITGAYQDVTAGQVANIKLTSTGNGVNNYIIKFMAINAADSLDFIAWHPQGEAKAYATSWQIGGTARAAETLTAPTAGAFTKGSWTVELVYEPKIPTTVIITEIFRIFIDANNYYRLYKTTDGRMALAINSGGTIYSTYIGTESVLAINTKYRIGITGNGSVLNLFLDGAKIGTANKAYVEPVGALPTNMYIGSNEAGTFQANGIIDDICISSIARTDAEMQSRGASAEPLGVDNYTTAKMDCDGNLTIIGVTTGVPGATETKTTNPSVTIDSDTFTWTGTLDHDEVLAIDNAPDMLTVLKGGANAIATQGGDFPLKLAVGANNVVYSDTGSNRAKVTVKQRGRYL